MDAGRGVCGGAIRITRLTRFGWARVKCKAMRQPREFWAMSVAPAVMLACVKRAERSDVKDAMLRVLRGCVGERPWPSRSRRWHLFFLWRWRWWIRGVTRCGHVISNCFRSGIRTLGLLTGFVCVAEAMDENNGSAIVGAKGAVVEGFII